MDLRPAATDHRSPAAGPRTPTARRRPTPSWRRQAWRDLERWIEWVVWAYSLEGSDEGWARWWTSPGAVEQLVALRDWHHELVDVEVAQMVPEGASPTASGALEVVRRRERRDRARELASWHDALERAVTRIAGPEARDLVGRQRDRTGKSATGRRVSQLRDAAREGFNEFLLSLQASGDVTPPPDEGSRASAER